MRQIVITIALAFGILVGARGMVSAQEASPVADVACDVDPRSGEELLALWYAADGSPIGTWATPVAEEMMTEISIPVGAPADEATTAAITAVVQEVFACFDSGDFLAAFALFTDNLVGNFGPEPGTTFEDAQAFISLPAEPSPPEEQSELVAVANPMVLADGRVGAFFIERYAGYDSVSFVFFVEENGSWLADEVLEFPAPDDE